ncbi:sugar phosphate nucleotidyltransferase [Natronorubrum halophilum]|uniref:sugar phosphate nucleotidyltransferase n=1 Tax=Natronorubrum halophilum TaxID=1702106 RepID=UPI0010C167CE|nr:sugar phosphate nucleotidyltransferase [Natronorubrum halophilum]
MSVSSAVVLAAGEGIRLRPLTRNRPKPMLPAGTRPILEHVFDQLIAADIDSIAVVVGYRGDRIRSYFGSSYREIELTYVEQERQLGTGHALRLASSVIDGATVVVNGDQFVDSRIIEDVVATHDADAAATIGLINRQEIGEYGGVILEDDGSVVELVENPQDDRAYRLNAGVYVVDPNLLETIERLDMTPGEHSLVDAMTTLLEDGETVRGVVSEGWWIDAMYPWDLLAVSDMLFDAGVIGDEVAASAIVHDSAIVRSPVVVDRDCEIGPGAVVGPHACLGENTTVGSNAVVERSVIDADTRIGANATAIDCVTGVGVDLGHGTVVPGGPGDARIGDRFFEDAPIGALLADRVTDNGGVTYVPGAIVGAAVTIEAGATVRGTIDDDTEVHS